MKKANQKTELSDANPFLAIVKMTSELRLRTCTLDLLEGLESAQSFMIITIKFFITESVRTFGTKHARAASKCFNLTKFFMPTDRKIC